jgi:hypothetical protein
MSGSPKVSSSSQESSIDYELDKKGIDYMKNG